jgi:hypothetical protein
MVHPDQIKPDMLVIGTEDSQFATIEQMEGTNYLKLKPDEAGLAHYLPLHWVSAIEANKVKIDRSSEAAMQEWSSVSPTF